MLHPFEAIKLCFFIKKGKRGGSRRESADTAGDSDKGNVRLRTLSQKTETVETTRERKTEFNCGYS